MNNMTSLFRRLFVFTVAIVAALVTIGIIRVAASASLQEILLDADSEQWPFTVQNIMWVSLFIGFGELFLRWSAASDEENQLKRGYLPTDGRKLDVDTLGRIKTGIVAVSYTHLTLPTILLV